MSSEMPSQVLGRAIFAVDRDFPGMEEPPPLQPSFNRLFRNIEAAAVLQNFAVHGREKVCLLFWEKIIIALADEFLPRIPEQLFTRLVETDKLESLASLTKIM